MEAAAVLMHSVGLSFITIGASIQFQLLLLHPPLIAQWEIAILAGKACLVYMIGRLFRMKAPESLHFAITLAMGGEFAFSEPTA